MTQLPFSEQTAPLTTKTLKPPIRSNPLQSSAGVPILLAGILDDLKKLSRLGDHAFVIDKPLEPSFLRAVAAGAIDAREQAALDVVANKTIIKASDLSVMFSGSDVARSQFIRRLIERRLIEPVADGKRTCRLVMSPDR